MPTVYGDPNSDVGTYPWTDTTGSDNYTRIDDGVRYPSAPGTSDYCDAGDSDDNELASFGCTEPSISGTVSSVVAYAYMLSGTGTLNGVLLGAYFNGSNQTDASVNVTDTLAWYTKTYSGLSIPAGSFFPWRLNITSPSMGKSDDLFVYGGYLSLDYTTGGGGGSQNGAFLIFSGVMDPMRNLWYPSDFEDSYGKSICPIRPKLTRNCFALQASNARLSMPLSFRRRQRILSPTHRLLPCGRRSQKYSQLQLNKI